MLVLKLLSCVLGTTYVREKQLRDNLITVRHICFSREERFLSSSFFFFFFSKAAKEGGFATVEETSKVYFLHRFSKGAA